VTPEYPPNRTFDSVSIGRVSDLRDCDLTPRQRSSRCLCTQVVHDERAARVLVFVSRSAGMKRRMNRTEIGSRASERFPERTPAADPDPAAAPSRISCWRRAQPRQCSSRASTRPAAGPSGIDDACARHDVGTGTKPGTEKVRFSPSCFGPAGADPLSRQDSVDAFSAQSRHTPRSRPALQ
jgi:hypothetical protein